MNKTERIWVKEFTGIEVLDLPGLIALGYTVYMSAMSDTQGWRVRDVKPGENPFDDPSTVLFVEDVLEPILVKPEDKARFYIVGSPEPWSRPPEGHV